jgi:hypothetical protein
MPLAGRKNWMFGKAAEARINPEIYKGQHPTTLLKGNRLAMERHDNYQVPQINVKIFHGSVRLRPMRQGSPRTSYSPSNTYAEFEKPCHAIKNLNKL